MNLSDYTKGEGWDWSKIYELEAHNPNEAEELYWNLTEKGILSYRPKPGNFCIVFGPAGINKNPIGISSFFIL